jgi:hypothetical protein
MYEAGGNALIHTWPDAGELDELVADITTLRSKVDVLVSAHHWRLVGRERRPGKLEGELERPADVGRDTRRARGRRRSRRGRVRAGASGRHEREGDRHADHRGRRNVARSHGRRTDAMATGFHEAAT